MSQSGTIWYPLFEAAAQTFVGAVAQYISTKVRPRVFKKNYFMGAQDLWFRGIMSGNVQEGDRVTVEGSVSCFVQVFPGNPFDNAKRWDRLYQFSGTIDKYTFQTLDFTAGSDSALRVGSLNGETIIGIYNQYAYIGEGIIGVVPTKYLTKALPNALDPTFCVARAAVGGRLARCPAQHGFVIQTLCAKAGLSFDLAGYQKLWYLLVDWIKPMSGQWAKHATLLGSPWAATNDHEHQYLLAYGYFYSEEERR